MRTLKSLSLKLPIKGDKVESTPIPDKDLEAIRKNSKAFIELMNKKYGKTK